MNGLYGRDYLKLTREEISEKERLDAENRNGTRKFGITNIFHQYPKAIRHNMSLFPNNYMDIVELQNTTDLQQQCDDFEKLLNNDETKESDIKQYIQNNGYYHIPASIFNHYDFGHHEAVLFKEFQLGTSYRTDYLLAGRASGGWQFIFVEFESPYGSVVRQDGAFGEVVRKGINQIDEWKIFIESNYSTINLEFRKYTTHTLPDEFVRFDSSRMHYVVVAGRRMDFDNPTIRLKQRRSKKESNIKILHYDNLLDDARRLIGSKSY